METGLSGLDPVDPPGDGGPDAFRAALSQPRPDRLLMAAQAIRAAVVEVDAELERRVGPESVAQARTVLYALMAVGRDSAA